MAGWQAGQLVPTQLGHALGILASYTCSCMYLTSTELVTSDERIHRFINHV